MQRDLEEIVLGAALSKMAGTSRSFPLSTVLQYLVLSVLAYVLAGAPLLSIFTGSSQQSSLQRARNKPPPLSDEKAATLVIPEGNLSCPEHGFKGVHVLSREPLVVYIEGFLGEEEVRHVVEER